MTPEVIVLKIMAAIDQSIYADKVLDRAIDLAKREEAELTVVTVVEFSFVNTAELGGHPEMLEQFRRDSERRLGEVRKKVADKGLKAQIEVLEGASPADSIIQYADKHGIDLIVVGHKGRSAIERFLVGSVANKVVTHAPCSVLVVR